ncbi:hypothetical protein C8R34_12025 [Nitrosomonas sp. Nm84]|nr:hypothetical protein C8R34_12025 [Nitrosomonas sp. Nm84]
MIRWSENVIWQYFSSQTYTPKLPCDTTQIGRLRTAISESGVRALLKATIDVTVQVNVAKSAELERVIVATTVQEKAIAHPVDSRLLEIARSKIVQAAKRSGIILKQSYTRKARNYTAKLMVIACQAISSHA